MAVRVACGAGVGMRLASWGESIVRMVYERGVVDLNEFHATRANDSGCSLIIRNSFERRDAEGLDHCESLQSANCIRRDRSSDFITSRI